MGSIQIAKLLAVLAVLMGVAYASGAFDNAPSTIDVPVLEISTEGIDRIEVVTPLRTVVVEKSSGTWRMRDPVEWAADGGSISRFLSQLSELHLESVVSISEDRYDRYGVDSTAYVIKVNDGKEDYELVMSPKGPTQTSVYMRVNNDIRVFLASPRLAIPLSVSSWRDKLIASIPASSVVRASVTSPEESYALVRGAETGKWTIESTGSSIAADSLKTMRWLNRFRRFSADGFVADPIEEASPTHTLFFEVEDGSSIKLNIYKEKSRMVVSLDPDNGTLFYVLGSRESFVLPSSSSFEVSE